MTVFAGASAAVEAWIEHEGSTMSVEVHDALQDRVESISAQGACASDVDGMEDPGNTGV